MIESNFNLPKEKKGENQEVFKYDQQASSRFLIVSSLGITENLAAILTYIFGFISGVIILLVERKSRFVRFHALQSIYISIIFIIFCFLLKIGPLFSWISGLFLVFVGLVLWSSLISSAYKGRYSRIPYLSEFIKKHL